MGQVTGLLLGGFLIDWLGWRSIYLVILAIGGLGHDLAQAAHDDAERRLARKQSWIFAAPRNHVLANRTAGGVGLTSK